VRGEEVEKKQKKKKTKEKEGRKSTLGLEP